MNLRNVGEKGIEYNIGLDLGTGSVGWAVTDQQGNLLQRHPVIGLESDKQQGHKVVYNGLHNIADKAGIHSLLVGLFHLFSP